MTHRIRALLLAGLAPLAVPFAARAQTVPALDHALVVVMENKSYDEARAQPYTASLIAAASACTNAFAVAHPSQPNYLAMWCGSTLGITNDTCPPAGSPWPYENLGHALQAAGKGWRAYCEALPAVGSTACTAPNYVRRHCPWTYFSNLDHTRERPFSDLATDVAANALPALAYVIPDQCDNSHDCPISTGDAWLAAHLPDFIAAVGPRGVVIVTWDEDDNSASNHILTVFAGPLVKAGYSCTRRVDHYTVLRTLCDGLGLPSFGFALNETPVTDVWQAPTPATRVGWGRLKSIYR